MSILNELYEKRNGYSKNYDINVFKIEFKNYFDSKDKIELPENYTSEIIIQEFGIVKALEEAKRLLSNNSRLYELMYKANDFEKFQIVKYDHLAEYLPELNRLREILSPKQNELITHIDNNITDISKERLEFIKSINEEERAFMFHLFLKGLRDNVSTEEANSNPKKSKKYNIPTTEALVMPFLCNFQSSNKHLEKNRNSKTYKIVNKGLIEIKAKDEITFLKSILKNCIKLKLLVLADHVKLALDDKTLKSLK
jgi:hypothetical protein